MANTQDINKGSFIRHEGELVMILEYIHRTPGNLRAFYQAKMRNVKTGRLVEYRFRAGENVEPVRVETRKLQYLYKEGENYVCMDTQTYDQTPINGILFGDAGPFLKEGIEVTVSFDGDTAILAQLPSVVELTVTYTEPGMRGDTATKTLKPATVDTGATVRVPLFVNEGDVIRVDPSTGEYLERA